MNRWRTDGAAVLLCVSLPALASCGSGSFGIFAASDSSSGGGNGAPSVSAFRIEGTREAPAQIRFTVSDAESDPARIELCYQVDHGPGYGPPEPMTQLVLPPGIQGDPPSFPADRDGEDYTVDWNFSGESQLAADGRFEEPVRVMAILQGGVQVLVIGANDDFGVGNDPPDVTRAGMGLAGAELDGNVLVPFTVADTSDDPVDIRVEFNDDAANGFPDTSWQLARPGGAASTPDDAFVAVEADRDGTDLIFTWDTDHDLSDLERDVLVRFTPDDRTERGVPLATPMFRIDNNDEPLAVLDGGLIVASTDRRRAIPAPFEVFDEEGDTVELLFQWTREGEPFPAAPERSQLDAVRSDPALRLSFRVATEFPIHETGRVRTASADVARLPELAGSAAAVVRRGIVGRELEFLRKRSFPEPVAGGWTANPLRGPVAALPIGAGPRALVLDQGGGGARVSSMDLATGDLAELAGLAGTPGAMAYEHGEASVLVATDSGGVWSVARVEPDGTVTALVDASAGTTERGRVHAITSLGSGEALLLVGSSLVHVRFPGGGSASATAVAEGLEAPRGLARDPHDPNRVWVAERDAPVAAGVGRVVTVDLETREVRPIAAAGLQRPRAIAFDDAGARLLVVTDPGPGLGGLALRVLEPGKGESAELGPVPAGTVGSVAVGPAGLRILSLPDLDDLAVGGGVEQVRTVTGYDPVRQEVTVAPPFDPVPAPLTAWRHFEPLERIVARTDGARGTFVWDSSDLVGGGNALLRVVPYDAEKGVIGESDVSKEVLLSFDSPELPQLLDVGRTPVASAVADVDGDGDLDLVSANTNEVLFSLETSGAYLSDPGTLTIFRQQRSGVFEPRPTVLEVPFLSGGTLSNDSGEDDPVRRLSPSRPLDVVAADLDGDGDVDLASANHGASNLTLFFQDASGGFDPAPMVLGGPGVTDTPESLVAADVDGDGDLDLVTANSSGEALPRIERFFLEPRPPGSLTVFFQTAPGVFGRVPLRLGDAVPDFHPRDVKVGDLDGDGDLDLVSANRPDVAVNDFLVDGVPIEMLEGQNLTVFFQTSPGAFDPAPLVLGDGTTTSLPSSVVAADLDGDGDLDLASTNLGPPVNMFSGLPEIGSNVTFFFQTGPGVFALGQELGGLKDTVDPVDVTAADLDGDGDTDLAVAVTGFSFAGNQQDVVLLLQTSPGAFEISERRVGGTSFDGEDLVFETESPWDVVAEDLDGDGAVDLVVSSASVYQFGADAPGKVSIFLQSRRTVPARPLSLGEVDSRSFVRAGDLDADGDLDLVAGNRGTENTLSLFRQAGAGVFGGDTRLPISQPNDVALADLDGDGDLDIAATTVGDQNPDGFPPLFVDWGVRLFYQDASGDFDPTPIQLVIPAPNPFTSSPTTVSAADLDGDGDLDLAVPAHAAAHWALFFQDGAGAFGPLQRLETEGWEATVNPFEHLGTGPSQGVAADLDADGDLDLACKSNTWNPFAFEPPPGGDVRVFLQTAPGAFDEETITLGDGVTTNGPGPILASDLDLDGALDLVSVNSAGEDVALFYQDAPGSFALPLNLPVDSPRFVDAGDLEGDGLPDLVVTSDAEGFSGYGIWRQTAPRRFAGTLEVFQDELFIALNGVIAVDVDRDGELDLVLAENLGALLISYGGHE